MVNPVRQISDYRPRNLRHVVKLDSFHQRCLLQIAGIKWQDKAPNAVVLARCRLLVLRLCYWRASCGGQENYVARMPDTGIPKMLSYGQLATGIALSHYGQYKRYKDSLKVFVLQMLLRLRRLYKRDHFREPLAEEPLTISKLFVCRHCRDNGKRERNEQT